MAKPAYPHDGSEILGELQGASKPLAKNNPHRCTRGNCGQPLSSPAEQDAHNYQNHMVQSQPKRSALSTRPRS